MYCASDCVHELGRAGAKRGQATRSSTRHNVIKDPPTVTINERELDPQWRKNRVSERQWIRRNDIKCRRE